MRWIYKAMALSAFLCVTGLTWSTAQAAPMDQDRQLDVGHTVPANGVVVMQSGALVGLAWAQGSEDPCQYREYWYLSSDYIYPGSEGPGETIATTLQMLAASPKFESPSDFFNFARSLMPVGKRIVMPVFELENCGAGGFDP